MATVSEEVIICIVDLKIIKKFLFQMSKKKQYLLLDFAV